MKNFGDMNRTDFDRLVNDTNDFNDMVSLAKSLYTFVYETDRSRGHAVMPPASLKTPVFKPLFTQNPEEALKMLFKGWDCVEQLKEAGVIKAKVINEGRGYQPTKSNLNPAHPPQGGSGVPRVSGPTLIEQLSKDRVALEHYHSCTMQDEYLNQYRNFIKLKEQAPMLVQKFPEKRSLTDLVFWQEIAGILNEQKYMGQLLTGFTGLAPSQRHKIARVACDTILSLMKEEKMPFHKIMADWDSLYSSIVEDL